MTAHAHARYRGPSAVGEDLRRFWSLTFTLAATDFKLRFFGSALGYLWSLVRPLLLFGVLYVVFTEIIRFGAGVEHYPVYLLGALVLFRFLSVLRASCIVMGWPSEGSRDAGRQGRSVLASTISGDRSDERRS